MHKIGGEERQTANKRDKRGQIKKQHRGFIIFHIQVGLALNHFASKEKKTFLFMPSSVGMSHRWLRDEHKLETVHWRKYLESEFIS